MTARKGRVIEERSTLSRVLHEYFVPTIIPLVTFAVFVVGAVFVVDERYAHAGDIKVIASQLEINRITAEVSVLEIRRSTLQDKVYEGRSRNSRNRSDVEILDRYQRELADVDSQITAKRAQINQMRKP